MSARDEFLPASAREFLHALASLVVGAMLLGVVLAAWGLWGN